MSGNATRDSVRTMILDGMTVAEVAARLNLQVPRVHAWIADLRATDPDFLKAFPRKRLPRAEAVQRHKAIRELAEKGLTRRQVAKALGIGIGDVKNIERYAREAGRRIVFAKDKGGRPRCTKERMRINRRDADAFAAMDTMMSGSGDWVGLVRRLLTVLASEPVLVKNLLEDA